jgi:hypothetical protein
MKEIRNKTSKPVRVPLQQGKTLFLGPAQTVAKFQKLVADEIIELVGDGERVAADKGAGTAKSRSQGGGKSFRRVQGDR